MQFGLRTFMFVVLLLGMVVASYPLLFRPIRDRRDTLNAEIATKRQQLTDLSSVESRTKDMPTEIANLKRAIDFLTNKLPAESEMDKILGQVWQAAKDNNLTVKSVRNGKALEGINYNEQPVRMVIEGPFNPGFFKFLSQVEMMPRLTKIKQMKIDAQEKSNGMITADLELTIYYEPTQKVVVAQ